LFQLFGVHLNFQTLKIILPIGISFYTFKNISYLIDIDNEKIEPTKNWVVFSAYVSFFPNLLAGPIDRANTFIPQLEKKRVFDYNQAIFGLKQILWGLFKKLVIANNCNTITNNIFSNYQNLPASTLLLGAFFFIIQLYADFSGYSDMAIGFSRLIGFNLTKNFNYPFFAKNISEFWQRWHISLTSWMTVYVFTPLTFSFRKLRKTGLIIAIIINFIIVGLWHGANFTYLLFGLIQGCLFIPLILKDTLSNKKTQVIANFSPSFIEFLYMTGTFVLIMFSAVLLRSESIEQAFQFYVSICNKSLLSIPLLPNYKTISLTTLVLIIIMFMIEWFGQNQDFAIEKTGNNWSRNKRWLFYSFLIFIIGVFMHTEETAFIYFQF
jgi:D-alanyl-lipoteichoic acid acyltransferase DltB (MBOAT superfamily)